MSVTIYYFSGTGNSFHIARELQRRIPACDLIPMVSLLREEVIETKAETVGFVFPVHCTTLPVPVRIFFNKLDLSSSRYTFAVSTQGGAPPRLVELHLEKILEEKGHGLDAFFSIKMHWASPVGLMPVYIPGLIEYPKPKRKLLKLEAEAQKKLDVIQGVVENREQNPKDDFPRALNYHLKQLIARLMAPATDGMEDQEIQYYADADCNGCGVCETVCLSEKIKLVDGQPVWQPEVQCYFCYACFSICPSQSILVEKIYTKKEGRYFHPQVSANDIARQK